MGMLALALAGVAFAQPSRPATIEGRVLDAATGAPLRKTALTLRPVGGPQRAQQNGNAPGGAPQQQRQRQQSTTTDAEGRFSFVISAPGDFRIGANRTGYVTAEYGAPKPGAAGKTVKVAEGQRVTGIDIKMTPHGVIAGRVVDEDGDPVERAQVVVSARLNRRSQGASTNDLGEFRVAGLAAGKYYLTATRMGAAPTDGLSQQGEDVYAPTYFPGTTDAASASTITVAPGQQVTGIFVPLKKARVYRVSGVISGSMGEASEEPARGPNGIQLPRRAPGSPRVMINLVERGASAARALGRTLNARNVGSDGSFEVPNVPPGSYWAVAIGQQRGAVVVGRAPLEVRNGNVSNLVVPVAPPITISGVAHADSRETLTLANARIQLSPIDGPGGATAGQVQANGTFQMTNVSRDRFRVVATGLPDGVYLKSVRVGGQEAPRTGLDLTNAPATMALELLFSGKAASVAGTVRLGAENVPGNVLLAREPFDENEPSSAPVGTLIPVGETGAFTIKNVPPGSYRIYAFEEVVAQDVDAALLKRLESRSERLTLAESGTANVELRQIPAEESAE